MTGVFGKFWIFKLPLWCNNEDNDTIIYYDSSGFSACGVRLWIFFRVIRFGGGAPCACAQAA